jgi:hypothetical protein
MLTCISFEHFNGRVRYVSRLEDWTLRIFDFKKETKVSLKRGQKSAPSAVIGLKRNSLPIVKENVGWDSMQRGAIEAIHISLWDICNERPFWVRADPRRPAKVKAIDLFWFDSTLTISQRYFLLLKEGGLLLVWKSYYPPTPVLYTSYLQSGPKLAKEWKPTLSSISCWQIVPAVTIVLSQ